MEPNAEDELHAITALLCSRYPTVFKRLSSDMLEISDPREAILLAAIVQDSFFLKPELGKTKDYEIHLGREFATRWATDFKEDYPALFEGKKVVKFFPHWYPVAGYTGKGAEYRATKRLKKMIEDLEKKVREEGKEISDVLFVPYWYYTRGRQFSEQVYHYLAGLVFRDMGYFVCNEYTPSIVSGTGDTPDLPAFKTEEISGMMNALKSKGMVANGAFEQELQLYAIFGRTNPSKLHKMDEVTTAESIVVEAKRSESQYLIEEGFAQLRRYMANAYGFYDEAYLVAPFINGSGVISFGYDGELVFEKYKPSNDRTVLSDYWEVKWRAQMLDVRASLILQLLKNLPLSQIVDVCGGEQIRNYSDLQGAWVSLEIEPVIDALES